MLNSKDSTYNLQLYKVDKVLVGFILDKKNNKGFSYQVNNSTSGFDFRYLNSQDMNFEKSKNYKSNFVFDRKLQIIDSVFSNLKITVFKNNQRKNIVRQIEILLKSLSNEPSETDTLNEKPIILDSLKSLTQSLNLK